jgi:hypothetical protein
LYTAWMGPLVRVTYSGLTQSVFRLDRMKSSSCDCPAKIPVDSNASCFTYFSSGSRTPEVVEFCPTLRLVYLSLGLEPPLAHYPGCIVCLVTSLFKKSFHKGKNSVALLWLLRTCMCPMFFFWKKTIVIPQAAQGPGHVLSCGIPNVYSSTLQLLP